MRSEFFNRMMKCDMVLFTFMIVGSCKHLFILAVSCLIGNIGWKLDPEEQTITSILVASECVLASW